MNCCRVFQQLVNYNIITCTVYTTITQSSMERYLAHVITVHTVDGSLYTAAKVFKVNKSGKSVNSLVLVSTKKSP